MNAFISSFPIGPEDAPGQVTRAREHWRDIAGVDLAAGPGPAFEPAFEIAWLLLDEVALTPSEPEDDEERELVRRLGLFMQLVPDGARWVRYLASFPAGDAHAAWRAYRSEHARLHHGAIHPDLASLCGPSGAHDAFLRQHLSGPVVCLACRALSAGHVLPTRLASATPRLLVDLDATTRDNDDRPCEVTIRAFDDDGWLRVHVASADASDVLEGTWRFELFTDERRYAATITLPGRGWHGHNLGRLPSGPRQDVRRITIASAGEAAPGSPGAPDAPR